ncbi:uncharacterized protein LOC112045392 [Bicyclus anynana]|uniref:Uncharacterized protein LOC112045392 n=1 Tax=Bicyclus anynana TaxID=110368 RepID=A0ABM3M0Q5_BICAN|nr:uncharacterized protein LOC112045392 [Bicyclus anynana]XP_052744906.1 uncharacterized protein LOC112045392 [Bicyclus anynana]
MTTLSKNCILVGIVDYYCLVCEIYLKSERDANIHIAKSVHQRQLDSVQYVEEFKNDTIKKIKNKYFCELCNKLLAVLPRVRLHITELTHINKNHRLFRRYGNYVIAFQNIAISDQSWNSLNGSACAICNVEYEIENEDVHKNESTHILNVIQIQVQFDDNKNIYRKIDDATFQCTTCNMLYALSSLTSHFAGEKHKKIYQDCCDAYSMIAGNIQTEEIIDCNKTNEKQVAVCELSVNNEIQLQDFIEPESIINETTENTPNIDTTGELLDCKEKAINVDTTGELLNRKEEVINVNRTSELLDCKEEAINVNTTSELLDCKEAINVNTTSELLDCKEKAINVDTTSELLDCKEALNVDIIGEKLECKEEAINVNTTNELLHCNKEAINVNLTSELLDCKEKAINVDTIREQLDCKENAINVDTTCGLISCKDEITKNVQPVEKANKIEACTPDKNNNKHAKSKVEKTKTTFEDSPKEVSKNLSNKTQTKKVNNKDGTVYEKEEVKICETLHCTDHITRTENNETLCILCNLTKVNPNNHVDSKHHQILLKLHKQRLQKMGNNTIDDCHTQGTQNDSDDILDKLPKFQKEEVNINFESKTAYCKKCKTHIEFVLKSIENHISEHKTKTVNKTIKCNVFDSLPKAADKNKNLFTSPVFLKAKNDKMQTDKQENACTEKIVSDKPNESNIPEALPSNERDDISSNGDSKSSYIVKVQSAKTKKTKSVNLIKMPLKDFVHSMVAIQYLMYKDLLINEKYCINFLSFSFLVVSLPDLRCQVCDECLGDQIGNHLSELSHTRYMRLTSVIENDDTEFIREVQTGSFHCGYCNTMETSWDMMEGHLKSSAHKEIKASAMWRRTIYLDRIQESKQTDFDTIITDDIQMEKISKRFC